MILLKCLYKARNVSDHVYVYYGISVCLCFYDFIEVLVQSQECEWPCLCVLSQDISLSVFL